MPLARASRILLSACLPAAARPAISAPLRYKSTTSDAKASDTTPPHRSVAAATSPPGPSDLAQFPAVDLEAPIDHATSAYSPVPSFPEDRGPDDALAASTISGAPLEMQARTVRIYKPTKAATQSGHWNGRQWRMDWDVLPRGHRWENPLMGWQSSGDFMQGTHIFFKTKEDAIHFAEKQGYDWFVQEPQEREFRSKSYAANFVHSPKKLKIIRTK